MSNTANSKQPMSSIVKLGTRTAYQIFGRNYNGQTKLSARVGAYWVNPTTGQATIIPDFDLYNYDEQTRARQAAKKHLEKLTAQIFQQQQHVNQVEFVPQAAPQPAAPQVSSQPVAQQHPIPQQPLVAAEQLWTGAEPQPLQPPKPYPSGGNY